MRNTVLMVTILTGLAWCSVAQGALLGHYTFEDNLANSASSNYQGEARGATLTYVAGPDGFGKAVRLNGTDNYINIGTYDELNSSNMTVAAWIYDETPTTTNQFSGIINRMGYTGDWALRRYSFNNPSYPDLDAKFQLVVNNNYSTVATLPTQDVLSGQWVHIAATFNSGVVKYYVNGVLSGGYTGVDTTITANQLAVLIGRDANREAFFKGAIDDVRLYNSTLTDTEVANLTVPEPATMGLLALGGLGVLTRRKK